MVAEVVAAPSLLVALVLLVDRIPVPPPPTKRARGRPTIYPDRLFLKALVLMLVRHLAKVHELLAVLEEPTAEMCHLRALLTEQGRSPARRTWERRLAWLPDTLPAQIGCLGRSLVGRLQPWHDGGRAAAIDRTVLRAHGGVWHHKHRAAGIVPHTSSATEAGWTKSGWHGWVYGGKRHLVVTVAAVWLPLAADLTPANVADNEHAPLLLAELPHALCFLLGDTSDNDPDLHACCAANGRVLVATKRGPSPHTDDGATVRQVFHALRSHAIEHCNEPYKSLFGGHGQVPTRGLLATRRHALGAVFVSQLLLLHRFTAGQARRVGLKPCLQAA